MVGSAARSLYRVFIGNLPWTIGTNELRQFGSTFGSVQHAIVVFDKVKGMSKGFGFITFNTSEAYTAALASGAGSFVLEGNRLNIQAVNLGSNQQP